MPVLKYKAVHFTPKEHLKYILNPDKNEELRYATAENTSTDYNIAYDNFMELFERYDSEKFSAVDKSGIKKHIRIHSYIQSFDDTVTAETAHKIGVEWAKKMFGEDRPFIVSTHTNTGHVHNHIAVCPYDFKGNRFHANKKSLARGRQLSDLISKDYGVSIIEKPCRKNKLTYAEWLARRENNSWKVQMADDIDSLIVSEDVTDIGTLIVKMKSKGYVFTSEERLIAKPQNAKSRYGCSFARLGFGYSREMLEKRILTKDSELLGRKISGDLGFRIELEICYREMQFEIYRTDPKKIRENAWKEIQQTLRLLEFLSDKNIKSQKAFEEYLNELAEKEKHAQAWVDYDEQTVKSGVAYEGEYYVRFREEHAKSLSDIKAEKKEASACFDTYRNLLLTDYDRFMKREKLKQEAERYRQEHKKELRRKQLAEEKEQEEYYKYKGESR